MAALQQAWFGAFSDRLIAVRFESLTNNPKEVMSQIYKLINEPYFDHNFEDLEFSEYRS